MSLPFFQEYVGIVIQNQPSIFLDFTPQNLFELSQTQIHILKKSQDRSEPPVFGVKYPGFFLNGVPFECDV